MSAAVVIILNPRPKTQPKSIDLLALGPDARVFEVVVPDNATDVQVLHAALTELDPE